MPRPNEQASTSAKSTPHRPLASDVTRRGEHDPAADGERNIRRYVLLFSMANPAIADGHLPEQARSSRGERTGIRGTASRGMTAGDHRETVPSGRPMMDAEKQQTRTQHLGRDDIVQLVGEVEDATIAAIQATGATYHEIEQALRWAGAGLEEPRVNAHGMTPRAEQVFDILLSDPAYADEDQEVLR
jgi:hypothetical protein